MLVQEVLEQVQAELEETEVAAVCAMNALIPAVDHAEYAKVDHPDVGKTSGDQQASQALWLADMTLVELKAATLTLDDFTVLAHPLTRVIVLQQLPEP